MVFSHGNDSGILLDLLMLQNVVSSEASDGISWRCYTRTLESVASSISFACSGCLQDYNSYIVTQKHRIALSRTWRRIAV